ncbi:hypothetical protein HMPREF0185_00356 [Brevundimonas diminuta 470-4]|nr:hypothetical protein HMPREF0185_00356 [Brevundimonas diminuta 470-4]
MSQPPRSKERARATPRMNCRAQRSRFPEIHASSEDEAVS